MRRLLVLLLLLGAGSGVFFLGRALRDRAATQRAGDAAEPRLGPHPLSQFLIEHDLFLPATDPATVSAEEAAFLLPDDEVFGVIVSGQARAYPVTMLSYHHVVNDVIRGIPVAVTY